MTYDDINELPIVLGYRDVLEDITIRKHDFYYTVCDHETGREKVVSHVGWHDDPLVVIPVGSYAACHGVDILLD